MNEQTLKVLPKYAHPGEYLLCSLWQDDGKWHLLIVLWDEFTQTITHNCLHKTEHATRFGCLRTIIDWRDNSC